MDAQSLSTLANYAEILGALTIVSGLVFGWFQLRQYRTQQQQAVAMNLMQTFYNHDLARAVSLLQPLPDGITLSELRALGDEYHDAAITVATSFETMGLLMYQRIAPAPLVMNLAGGMVATMSRKLARWQEDMREAQDQPSWGEWFEWLGDQARKRKNEGQPAHIQHRDWRP